ncbi:MAG TPA: hypothetical protein GX497_15965 [Bacillus bacterium]|nr:hypothetical protein [Bacillus sp. (in: firmicutes)]
MRIQAVGNAATNPITATQRSEASFEDVLMNTQVTKKDNPENTITNIYENLSNKYDVRKATFEEIKEISHSLYEAGEISLKEVAILTFDYERATNDIKNQVGSVSPNFSLYETEANKNGQRDWIAEYEARAAKFFQSGDLVGYQNSTKILNILREIQKR